MRRYGWPVPLGVGSRVKFSAEGLDRCVPMPGCDPQTAVGVITSRWFYGWRVEWDCSNQETRAWAGSYPDEAIEAA